MVKRAYRFRLEPEFVEGVTEYLTVDLGEDELAEVHAAIEEDPDGYFGELIGDRHHGYILTYWEEVRPDQIPEGERPFTLS